MLLNYYSLLYANQGCHKYIQTHMQFKKHSRFVIQNRFLHILVLYEINIVIISYSATKTLRDIIRKTYMPGFIILNDMLHTFH